MKTKNILSLLMLAMPALLFTSCVEDEDDVFDESSSARMQEAMNNAKAVLRGAENGWVMDYYIGEESSSGGYAYYVKFDSLTVTAMSETTDGSETSYYKITNDNGPVLTFDTYSSILHEFSTPSADNYEAYHADFEFLILSATSEKVVLKGKRTDNRVYLYPLSADDTPEAYLEKVKAMQDSLIVSIGEGTLDGVTIDATLDHDNRQATFVSTAGDSTSCAFTYTDKGIRLNQTLEFASKSVTSFSFDGSTNVITCLDEGNTDFTMQCTYPATWRAYDEIPGTYILNYGDTGYEASITVEIVSNGDNSTFSMSGLNSNYDVTCNYNKSNGCIEINPHRLTTVGSYDLYLCVLNNDYYLTWATSAGLLFTWNGDEENPVYEAGPNSYTDFYASGFCLWVFSDGSSLGSSAVSSWFQSNTAYLINGDYLLEQVQNLTKID